MNYIIHLLVYFDIYVIVALSLNLVVGYGGLITLAHAGFYAVGGYAYAILALTYGWDFLPAALTGAAIAAALSLAVSLAAWRLRGDFFVLASLSAQALIFSILYNWSNPNAPLGTWRNLTNGPFGITSVPRPAFFGWHIPNIVFFVLVATIAVLCCGLVLRRLMFSPWGRLLLAIREDELAARGLGKNTRLAKVQVFAISGALAALAGALYAGYVQFIDPSAASLDESILMLSMVIVGGSGNFRGPIVGAATLLIIPEVLRFLSLPDAEAANLRSLVYGLLLVLLMHLRPQGLAGEYRV